MVHNYPQMKEKTLKNFTMDKKIMKIKQNK